MVKGQTFGSFLVALFLLFGTESAFCGTSIRLDYIAEIESSGRSWVVNSRSGATGMYQVTRILLDDYAKYGSGERFYLRDMLDPSKGEKVALWAFNERFPAVLRWLGKPVTERNLLICYNAGCGYVGRELPLETVGYLKKYDNLKRRGL